MPGYHPFTWTQKKTGDRDLADQILSANTARHAFGIIRKRSPEVISHVGQRIVKSAQRFAGDKIRIQSVIFDYTGKVVFDSDKPLTEDR